MTFSLHLNPETFSALKSRNFRIFLIGQSAALTGLWMQKLANSWLVYRLTESGIKLGMIELAGNAPIFVLGLFAGAWLDKHDIRKTMIVTQALVMLNAAVIAVLLLTGTVQFWHILSLSFLLGCVNAVDLPARQSSILLMIEEKRQLKSALALHSMMFNLSRLIGPSIAGFVIYYTSETFCYIFTVVCYVPVLVALWVIRFKDRNISKEKMSPLKSAMEGLSYAAHYFPLKSVLIFLSMFAMFSYSYSVLFPIFAKDILMGGPRLLGFLLGGIGFGAVFGAFSLASFIEFRQLPKAIAIFSMMYVIFISLFAISPYPALSLILTVPAGFGMIATFVGTNTLIQTIADEDKRSRVVSLYTMCNVGLGPVGAFIAGVLAETVSARITFLIFAAIMCVASIFLWSKVPRINKELEPVFDRLESK